MHAMTNHSIVIIAPSKNIIISVFYLIFELNFPHKKRKKEIYTMDDRAEVVYEKNYK